MLHLRPRNRFEDLESVYLVGGGTHPGSGLPVIFESARITARLIGQEHGRPVAVDGPERTVRVARPGTGGAVASARRADRGRVNVAPRSDTEKRSTMTAGHPMRTMKDGRIGVIGGGLGGLAAACTLAARGYEVVLFEKNAWLGGKAAVLEVEGYRFDMGPTILLMPSVLKRIFAEAGRDLADELDLVPLDPQWRSFFEDGSTLDLHADRRRMAAAARFFRPGRPDLVGI